MKRLSIFLMALLLFGGCEKNITTECATEPQVEPKLSSIQKYIFNPNCVGCHSGSAASGGMDLSPGKAYANLVNVKATASELKRVLPGNSDQSYLMKRLTGADGQAIMPPSGKLPQTDLQAVRQWIDDGAKND